jgi:hypothetical protein
MFCIAAIESSNKSVTGNMGVCDGDGERDNLRNPVSSEERVSSGSVLRSVKEESLLRAICMGSEGVEGEAQWIAKGLEVYDTIGESVPGAIGTVICRLALRVALRRRLEVDGSIFKRTPRGGLQNDAANGPLNKEIHLN